MTTDSDPGQRDLLGRIEGAVPAASGRGVRLKSRPTQDGPSIIRIWHTGVSNGRWRAADTETDR